MSQLLAIHRYPVKSLVGEELDRVVVDHRGCVGDRLWSVRDPDGKLGSGKSTRRFRRMDGLLDLAAAYDRGDAPVVTFPDGRRLRAGSAAADEAVSDHVGRPVTLGREEQVSHFDEGPVHLVTTASLHTLARAHGCPVDVRHTRANLLVEWDDEGFPEHGWIGREVALGTEVVLRIRDVMPRCVMLNAAQGALPADDRLLRTVTGVSAGALGVVADVEHGGLLRVGDRVRLGG
jgi:uncharacterized protein YcbX